MKAYGKSWDYNVYDCPYCLYWKGKKKGCTYPDGCCCPTEQKPARRNGIEQVYDKDTDKLRFRNVRAVLMAEILPASGGVPKKSCAP